MEHRLLGWPEDGPRLDLDHETFAYAGNFRTGRAGVAVALGAAAPDGRIDATGDEPVAVDGVLGAASFDADRAADGALRIRYVTVREDRRGEGIGPRLLAFVVDRARDRGYARVRIGVNNPIAYRACYRAGFGFAGEESGMGELVLEAPPPADATAESYRDGFARFAERDLPAHQRAVVDRHADGTPPEPIESEDAARPHD